MNPPGWLVEALTRVWLLCAGCTFVELSLKYAPVEDDVPAEDSRWDWVPVIHHAEECLVLDDPQAQAELGDELVSQLLGTYCEPAPLHTALAAP